MTVIPFRPKNPGRGRTPPQDHDLTQLAHFFYGQAAQSDVAIHLLAGIAAKSFVEEELLDGVRQFLSKLRWRMIAEREIPAVLKGLSKVQLGLSLQSLFEALHGGLRCGQWMATASVYHYNPEFRRRMSDETSLQCWLHDDFRALHQWSETCISPFLTEVSARLDSEWRRLHEKDFRNADAGAPRPYAIYLHETMQHFGFVAICFPGRTEVFELNQVTETIVGKFAYSGGKLERAHFLPGPDASVADPDDLPEVARRQTEALVDRLIQHLCLATPPTAERG